MKPLPSAHSAKAVVMQREGAWTLAAAHTLLRGALIAAGGYAAGVRGRALLAVSVGGAIAIEAFVLAWTYNEYQKAQPVIVPLRAVE